MTIAVLGTLDSKGEEHAFLAERIRERGHEVLLIDVGTGDAPTVAPDITREQILPAGFSSPGDRGACVAEISAAAPAFVAALAAEGRIDGVVSLGGTLYVADRDNHAIRRIADGRVTTIAGIADSPGFADSGIARSARFDQPVALVGRGRTLLIADYNNHRIRAISLTP